MSFKDINYHMAHSGYVPQDEQETALVELLKFNFDNPILKEPLAKDPLVHFIQTERQVIRILGVVDFHKTKDVFEALLLNYWNIDRSDEKLLFEYYKTNKDLTFECINRILTQWHDDPDGKIPWQVEQQLNDSYMIHEWFILSEMFEIIIRLKPYNCNEILLKIMKDDRLPLRFQSMTIKALGKIKEKRAIPLVIEQLYRWDTLQNFQICIEALKDLRANESLPKLRPILNNINKLIDDNGIATGNWIDSEESFNQSIESIIRRVVKNPYVKDNIEYQSRKLSIEKQITKIKTSLETTIKILEKVKN